VRQQIGSAVKGAMIHHEMIKQVALRERLEHERVSEEARVAADIQTSMIPVITEVPGLELAGLMLPTQETGGDYYDVIPMQTGAWLAIGDVTGHGLAAGLVMLMLQSMIAALARVEPEPQPSEVVSVVGDALWDNVRGRLKRDDHATLTVFRYQGDGCFRFAGAHEDIVVWRAATRRCETIPTPGFWVGALPSVRRMTTDSTLKLELGDVMVLYTDGVTEPRNAHKEQFSLERLLDLVEHHGHESAAALSERILQAVQAWSASLDDDVTLLVVRRVA
jgi:serine phosphatase RsbU (regulator of sigma subunit)